MSKSVGNVVNPDAVIDAYGADSLSPSKCSSAPGGSQALERKGIEGVHRFLRKVHRNACERTATMAKKPARIPCVFFMRHSQSNRGD